MKILKNIKIKIIFLFIIGFILGTIGYVIADSIITANQIAYTNSKSKNDVTKIDEALNELYDLSKNKCPNVRPYTITNLVKNGSFEDGTNNWTFSVEDKVVDTYKLYGKNSLELGATNSYSLANQSIDFDIKVNHKYYGRMYIYSESAITFTNRYEIFNNTDNIDIGLLEFTYDNQILTVTSIPNEWKSVSRISSVTNLGSSNDWHIRMVSLNNKTVYADGLLIVDLTETFGAGNEPTKAWCDENINYFDGTTTIYK